MVLLALTLVLVDHASHDEVEVGSVFLLELVLHDSQAVEVEVFLADEEVEDHSDQDDGSAALDEVVELHADQLVADGVVEVLELEVHGSWRISHLRLNSTSNLPKQRQQRWLG